ncbi:GNAT family N-acetyltransferase [Novosphingobium sp.]|uniref:GNAT family N-acetyltransferase n=1 Tax=Novosphingobium sp. TaxID=1874826 RepID=UPI0038BE0B7D
MADFRLETERLVLRDWREDDVAPFHALCSDARVMEFLGPLQERSEAEAAVERQNALQDLVGYCFWALERRSDGAFLGFCGLKPGPEGTPLDGVTEIGWRLAYEAWGQGYAREAALTALAWGFANLFDQTIWAMTVPANLRSQGLMQRLGMRRHERLDFDHPALAEGDPLRRHVVYAIGRGDTLR